MRTEPTNQTPISKIPSAIPLTESLSSTPPPKPSRDAGEQYIMWNGASAIPSRPTGIDRPWISGAAITPTHA